MNHRRAPGLGENTTEILTQYLGYDEKAIADLKRREVV
jgi:crotonobetainyl-CoA:carnitine CoA-transferase CaiB-like acyl-CoA transferase